MAEKVNPHFKRKHHAQRSDRQRRLEIRAQRRAAGEINPARRAWKRGRTTSFYGSR